MAGKKKRKVPPARLRYEKNHPTVTCRVSLDIYKRIDESRKIDGKSFADIFKLGLGLAEKRDKKVKAAKEQSWEEGYDEGYDEGYRDRLAEKKNLPTNES